MPIIIVFELLLMVLAFSILLIIGYGMLSLVRSIKSFKIVNDNGNKKVSVIISARNEEGKINKLLDDLLHVNSRLDKIIIVNDRSTDNTRQIVENYMKLDNRINLIDIKDVPKEWAPKNYALTQGVRLAGYENVLLFLDADIIGNMQKVIDIASTTKLGEIYSFMPYFECDNFISTTSQSFLSGLLHGYFGYNRTVNKKDRFGLMFGCCWSIMPYTYYEIGGHVSVKDEIMEDKNIATNSKSKGVKIVPIDGRDFISTKSWNTSNDIKNLLSRIFYDYQKGIKNKFFIYILVLGLAILFYLPLIWVPLLLLKQYFLSLIALLSYLFEVIFFYMGGLTNKIKKPYSIFYFISAYFLISGMLNAKRVGVLWKGQLFKSD